MTNAAGQKPRPRPDAKKIWFPAKRYGWGWGPPVCWQGWVVMAAWLLCLAPAAFLLPEHPVLFAADVLLLSAALIVVCWIKGEKPRWRWGDKPPAE